MIKTIVFDLGNVLINFDPRVFLRRFKKETGISYSRVVYYFLYEKGDKEYIEGKITSEEFFNKLSKDLEFDIPLEVFKDIWNNIFEINPVVEELIIDLKKEYPVLLLSNINDWHIEHIQGKYPIMKQFDQLFLSHELKCQKPDPKIYQHVLDQVASKPEEIFFTDDLKQNIKAAQELGICARQFTSAENLINELKKLGVIS